MEQSKRIKEVKEKVLVSAYACEPDLGSEIGVGWHWVLEMSKYFELWVLTRKSNQDTIETWMNKQEKTYDIHFVYFDLPKRLRFWKKGLRGVRTYYSIWQYLTNKIVKKTMEENGIKIYHLLTYGNSLWPASRYGMKQFFVWGPTGGVDTIPAEYSKYYDKKSRMIEFARRMIVKTLSLNRGFQKRCKNANLILCKSHYMYQAVPERYRDKALLFTDVAVEMMSVNEVVNLQKRDNCIKYIVVGKLDAWRGFDILIEAFEKAYRQNSDIRLEVLGKGTDKERLERMIAERDLKDVVTMTDEVSMVEYFEKVKDADVIVNSSLKEGAVTVSFDSMALSKPLICVDTGGYTRYFDNDYSVILKRGSREKLVNDMSDAIMKLTDPQIREKMGKKANDIGSRYTWEYKGKEIYNTIMKEYKKEINVYDESNGDNS